MLHANAVGAFDAALDRVHGEAALADLRDALRHARAHLDEPMRVALIGRICAGKSTFLNALLGATVAPTGAEELTFNVNVLRYAPEPGLLVHFKDGRTPEPRPLDEFAALVSRSEDGFLRSIRHVELLRPIDVLRTLEFIDTPGLQSFFGEDSANTMRSLGITSDDIEQATRRESSLADALLCLMPRSLASGDRSVVEQFQGPLLGNATPINTIGVLTKVDAYWDASDPDRDPLVEGARVAAGIHASRGADRVFYAVLPACGLLGIGARTIDDADVEALVTLSALRREALLDLLAFAPDFVADDHPVAVMPARRASLLDRLGQYGIWLATTLVHDCVDVVALREELFARSGVKAVRELVVSHFGHRALLIKAERGLRLSRAETLKARGNPAASDVGGMLEALECGEPAFGELALLKRYYQDAPALALRDGEERELLQVTAEFGTTLTARLGLPADAPPLAMVELAEARLRSWRRREHAFGADPRATATARVMAGAYERLVHHAREARRHLELLI